MHRNLRSFLDRLRRENDLTTIEVEVDPYLEIAEIHRRAIEQGGPALLFRRVKGSEFPVVTNLFGTAKRIELAFGPKPEKFIRELVRVAESLLPPKRTELWKHRSLVREFLKLGTRSVSRGPVTQVVSKQPRLSDLPVLTTWQQDGGPFITLPLVITRDPDSGARNVGCYRMQRLGPRETALAPSEVTARVQALRDYVVFLDRLLADTIAPRDSELVVLLSEPGRVAASAATTPCCKCS